MTSSSWAVPGPGATEPTLLFCENETNHGRLYGVSSSPAYPKDGINDHVVAGAATVNPQGRGTKCAFWYQVAVEPGATVELRLRLRPRGTGPEASAALGSSFDEVVAARRAEADEFYGELTPEAASADEALVMRQAFAGMLWSKQLYYYDVSRWLAGDPTQPPPPASRLSGRNSRWQNFDAFDIMSMPDKWEYPWFAAWDLAFHCVALAHLDPAFAKYQLILLCREWFQHPDGALPAYEWDFGDVNPPVQAWAALEVFAIDGGRDIDFLSRVFDKLLVNFTWWVNLEDREGNNLFEGGFLGLDNIGPIDRSHLPVGGTLEQSDATGWMAAYALAMTAMASILNRSGQRPGARSGAQVRRALRRHQRGHRHPGPVGRHRRPLLRPAGHPGRVQGGGEGPFHGRGHPRPGGRRGRRGDAGPGMAVAKRFPRLLRRQGLENLEKLAEAGLLKGEPGHRRLLLGVVGIERLERIFTKLFDESEFLSPYGLRAISAYHRDHPYRLEVEGIEASIDYEPAESTTDMFGGNSNWRGPLWFPLNYLVLESLERYDRFFGEELQIEYPTGSRQKLTLGQIAQDLRQRLVSIFLVGPDGRRPCFGGVERLQTDPAWKDNLVFNEYFHGDNGAGLGASHQTGWTGVIADTIRRRHGDVPSLGDVLRGIGPRFGPTVTAVRPAGPRPAAG